MAESRRVQLTTLSGDHGPPPPGEPVPVRVPPSVPAPHREPPSGDPADGSGRTVRLELTLFEADEMRFPEFSYTQLADNKIEHTKEKVQLSRFEEQEKREHEEIVATSRKLERKYGNEPKKKKKKQDRIQDLIDIGFGYDDEDSFIDNSEAYDEFVPASITTKFGGFYVNSGVLHFRQASETEDPATEEETLESSDVNGGLDEPTKKRCREDETIIRNVDPTSRALSQAGPVDEVKRKKKKKKRSAGPLSVTSMLKKFQREKAKERQKTEKANQKSPLPSPLCPADAGGGSGSTDPLLSLIGSTDDHAFIQAANAVDLDIDLDSLLDVTERTSSPKTAPPFPAEADGASRTFAVPQVRPPDGEINSQPKLHPEPIQPSSQSGSASPHRPVQLPEGLPPRLEDSIRKLTAVAKTSEGESKLKFFTPEINLVLLDIEVQCREQGVHLRSKVYTHLSSFLPCSRDTLLKRVKKLFLAQREDPPDVGDSLQKLREAIGRAMPEQIERFELSCVVYEQVKASRATEEKANFGPEDHVEEKGGRRGAGPKKSFQWNEEIRGSLCEVLRVRMERCKKEGKGSQEMENHLKTMLDNEVKPLWPKGWMQSRVLIRESRKMLSLFTSLLVKRARPEKRPQAIGAQSDSSGVPHGPPPLKRLLRGEDDVVITSPDVNVAPWLDPEEKEARGKPAEAAEDAASSSPAPATSAGTPSLLDVLADQALSREQPLLVSQELLAAAVAKYKHSVRRWGFGADTKSPPRPPQSSPVGFPLGGTCRGVLPQLVHFGDFARHMDASHVQIISDDDDITIQ